MNCLACGGSGHRVKGNGRGRNVTNDCQTCQTTGKRLVEVSHDPDRAEEFIFRTLDHAYRN